MRTSRSGYTLFELVLVLAIIVVVSAMAYPSLEAMYGGSRLTAAVDQVRAVWAGARAQALDEGRPYRFAVLPDSNFYRMAPDSADFWAGNGSPPPATDSDTPPLVMEGALPRGVRFSTPVAPADLGPEEAGTSLVPGNVDPGSWQPVVVFLPDGTAREDVEIVFRSRGARPVVLRLRALTGVVTARPFTEGNP